MNARPFQTAQSLKYRRPAGFALVVTLSLMILLTVIAVGLLSMSSVTMRKTNAEQPMAAARANAKLGLDLALDELQKAAGPDQRITAAADILSGNNTAKDGRKRWIGVWNTSTYNPATPDTKAFVRWLVSSNETTSTSTPNTSNLTMVASDPATTDYEIFKAVDYPSGTNNATNSVKVPKVEISSNSSTSKHYYAYWVEDEGLKADLGWKEGNATTSELKQAARLSAAPGADYGVFGGPFTSSNVKYPITKDSLTDNPWLANIDKALSPADMPLLMSSNSSLSNWLKSTRHDVTLGSLGVMADVKKGGLRRDLSLAFEMDGAAESGNATTNFNAQDGEFVGGNDTLTAPSLAPGMTVKERFLYRDTKGTGTPFSNDITSNTSIIRGPNWWALRDYANLYKRLSGTSGNYTLQARSYYPNRSAGGPLLGDLTTANRSGSTWDAEYTDGQYVYRPARCNYAPILLGSVCLYSATVTGGKLGLGVDSIIYLWNPYNRSLKFDKLGIIASYGFPGDITFVVNNGVSNTTYGAATLAAYLAANSGLEGGAISYLVPSLTMAPGEVVVVSPSSNRSTTARPLNDEAKPGLNTDMSSGVILTKHWNGTAWTEVSLGSTDTVSMRYVSSTGGNAWFMLRASLPPSSTTGNSLPSTPGEELQAPENNNWGDNGPIAEYFYPSQRTGTTVGPYASNTLVNTKKFFGIHTFLTKPAYHAGNKPNPVEVFSQFNPAHVGSTMSDIWRVCNFNQVYNMVSREGDINTLLQEVGVNFPATMLSNGFWGESYAAGSTSVPITNIPSAPIFSLASFSHAALSVRTSEPYHAVGNSWANLFVPRTSPFGPVKNRPANWGNPTASDSSWLINDALFDRYYLSGIAPTYSIGSSGYSANGTVTDSITKFFSSNYKSAQANPVLRPYLPTGGNSTTATTALAATDGYKKIGAYSLIDGAFNVNSTSIPAWRALLQANRDLAIKDTQGGTDNRSGSPFPSSNSPAALGNGAANFWSGFSRLTDTQIATLATEIVKQVKLRGPFMSLSNFVNRRVGTPQTLANDMGALQAAIEDSNINSTVRAGAGGTTPNYTSNTTGTNFAAYLPDPLPVGNRTTTTNIAQDITQAKLLEPLAPRLSARSDTFRIRSYGEVRSADGSKVISYAMCEAVVQRVPEYFDPVTNAANNEPWDEDTTASPLNPTNKTFGRRFNVISFRWLNPNEI